MITTENRKEIATALAKVIAYANCGKELDKEDWAIKLLVLLECHGLVDELCHDHIKTTKK